jgi:cell wall-associated NlpC family hydrolase
VTALLLGACASTGAVPRPFPGAALPPGATNPPAGGAPPAAPAEPPVAAIPPASATSPADGSAADTLIAQVVATALDYRGVPYRNGGSTPEGFDCSGLVQYVFALNGMRLPREVRDQFTVGDDVEDGEIRAGDLLFFDTSGAGASHVGIALGGGEFVHAPSSRGVVRVERYTGEYWKRRWVGARRVK